EKNSPIYRGVFGSELLACGRNEPGAGAECAVEVGLAFQCPAAEAHCRVAIHVHAAVIGDVHPAKTAEANLIARGESGGRENACASCTGFGPQGAENLRDFTVDGGRSRIREASSEGEFARG